MKVRDLIQQLKDFPDDAELADITSKEADGTPVRKYIDRVKLIYEPERHILILYSFSLKGKVA